MEIIDSGTRYRSRRWNVVANTLETASGRRIERDYIEHPGSVLILPVLETGEAVLIECYRHAVRKMLYEVPAGTCEFGEPAAATAARELIEETGYAADHLREVLQFYAAPGLTNERMVLYLATGLRHVGSDCEEDEEICTHICSKEAALAMTEDGRIHDAKSLVALWWWARQST